MKKRLPTETRNYTMLHFQNPKTQTLTSVYCFHDRDLKFGSYVQDKLKPRTQDEDVASRKVDIVNGMSHYYHQIKRCLLEENATKP